MFGEGSWRRQNGVVAIVLTAIVLGAYANSFRGAFLFDDHRAILENPTIQNGTGLGTLLQPPAFSTVTGRPLLNLSFALNHAISQDEVWSYHALNLLIHLAAGGLLFGVVRRTLERSGRLPGLPVAATTTIEPAGRDARRYPDESVIPAAVITGLWLLHPLQTESVTYIVQRAESLMGLLYLASFYCFVRAVGPGHARLWPALTVGCSLLGMAAKESMVTLPVVLLLYDRIFVAGSFTAAWRDRRGLYIGLAATWGLLAWLVIGTGSRGGSAGFGTNVGAFDYAITQLYAVARYVRLAVFPTPLIFDYGSELMKLNATVALSAAVCAVLLGATVVALIRRPAAGFLGAAFFLLLAPTSTFVPVASQTIAEHRMYLPLAPLVAAAVLGLHERLGRRALPLWIAIGAALGTTTVLRNHDYRSAVALWSDTVAKRPDNPRAHDWLGTATLAAKRPETALVHAQRAVVLQPDSPRFHNNLGSALATLGRYEAARQEFAAAFKLDPTFTAARLNLSQAETKIAIELIRDGRVEEAIAHLRRAAELEPEDPATTYNLKLTLEEVGRPAKP